LTGVEWTGVARTVEVVDLVDVDGLLPAGSASSVLHLIRLELEEEVPGAGEAGAGHC